MGELLLNDSTFLPMTPADAFATFGETGHGWLLSARFEEIRPGALAEMLIPVPAPTETGQVHRLRGSGRILDVAPWRRIVLRQESPWTADTIITFTPRDGGTLVRATASVTDDALGWMSTHLGQSISEERHEDEISLGLICSLSGEAAIFGRAILNCATLAVEELNRAGGVLGRPVRVVHVDEGTSDQLAVQRLDRILARGDLAAVIGSHTSQTLNALRPRILADNVLYLYAPVNEGAPRVGNLFRLGESSLDQLRYAIPELARRTRARRWFIIGNDYSWPRMIGDITRRQVATLGGGIVGERYLPFGHTRTDEILAEIERARPDVLVSALIGYDAVDFERRFAAEGFRSDVVTLAALMDDSTLEHLGAAANGIWSSLSYFSGEASSNEFVRRYEAAWGKHSPPPSAISASVYDSVHLWAEAVSRVRTLDPTTVGDALIGSRVDGSRGPVSVTSAGTLNTDMYLARVGGGGFEVIDSFRTARVS